MDENDKYWGEEIGFFPKHFQPIWYMSDIGLLE